MEAHPLERGDAGRGHRNAQKRPSAGADDDDLSFGSSPTAAGTEAMSFAVRSSSSEASFPSRRGGRSRSWRRSSTRRFTSPPISFGILPTWSAERELSDRRPGAERASFNEVGISRSSLPLGPSPPFARAPRRITRRAVPSPAARGAERHAQQILTQALEREQRGHSAAHRERAGRVEDEPATRRSHEREGVRRRRQEPSPEAASKRGGVARRRPTRRGRRASRDEPTRARPPWVARSPRS